MNLESVTRTVTTVNYHLLKQCNMRCGYCYATFGDTPAKYPLSLDDGLRLVTLLADAGFRKINFAGGEPTLCHWLPSLIQQAKGLGLTTSIVTNGSRITPHWLDGLAGVLDIAALSIDSVDAATQLQIGRTVGHQPPPTEQDYSQIAAWIKERNIRLKVNTVVNRFNQAEDFRPFILSVCPERWKIFQTLPVRYQNDARIGEFLISDAEFQQYVARHCAVAQSGIKVIPEDNRLMTGSYAMVDPLGRFFDDTQGEHTYSDPILQVGVTAALRQVSIYPERFLERNGNYA